MTKYTLKWTGKGDEAIITIYWKTLFTRKPRRTDYRGSGTVWTDTSTLTRPGVSYDLYLCGIWQSEKWALEDKKTLRAKEQL